MNDEFNAQSSARVACSALPSVWTGLDGDAVIGDVGDRLAQQRRSLLVRVRGGHWNAACRVIFRSFWTDLRGELQTMIVSPRQVVSPKQLVKKRHGAGFCVVSKQLGRAKSIDLVSRQFQVPVSRSHLRISVPISLMGIGVAIVVHAIDLNHDAYAMRKQQQKVHAKAQ
ncbi:hypothetical protein ACTJLB_02730 [Paraburkholderia sp. 22098]|uniref:hypothetical protein n=1 Tax=Paraburkholderia sp. 22098 TaxID=3453874 RepID=UPI003F82BEBA